MAPSPATDRVVGVPVPPTGDRATAWIRRSLPSWRAQTATPLPPPIEISGRIAFCPAAESVVIGPGAPEAGTGRPWTRVSEPTARVQMANALPKSSTSTRGKPAFAPAAERLRIGPRFPAVSIARPWARELAPSEPTQTA